MTQETMKELEMLGYCFKWIEKHETLSDIIILVELIAMAWVVFTYNFTTNF